MHQNIGNNSDHFCGDECCHGAVRAIVDVDKNNTEQLHSILPDSGADASIFPASLLGKGH